MQIQSFTPASAAHPLRAVRHTLDAAIDAMHEREFADASFQAGAAVTDAVAGMELLGPERSTSAYAVLRDQLVGDATWLAKVTMAAREISELVDGRLGPDAAAYAEQRIVHLTQHADDLHRSAVQALDAIIALRSTSAGRDEARSMPIR